MTTGGMSGWCVSAWFSSDSRPAHLCTREGNDLTKPVLLSRGLMVSVRRGSFSNGVSSAGGGSGPSALSPWSSMYKRLHLVVMFCGPPDAPAAMHHGCACKWARQLFSSVREKVFLSHVAFRAGCFERFRVFRGEGVRGLSSELGYFIGGGATMTRLRR